MKKLIYLSILFVSLFSTKAQVPAIVWQKCYGGTNSENANCIEKTTDGGYIVAGYTNTSADGDVTNNRGNHVVNKGLTYGGTILLLYTIFFYWDYLGDYSKLSLLISSIIGIDYFAYN
jgi:hypothetical protein